MFQSEIHKLPGSFTRIGLNEIIEVRSILVFNQTDSVNIESGVHL